MNKEFIVKCENLLNSDNEEIKNNERFYNLKEICMKEYINKKLTVPIGKIDENENVFMDFSDISGLFIAGTTGTGKSIFLDDLIVSLMLKNNCDELKFVFLEQYSIELGEYDGINYIYNDGKKTLTNSKKIKDILSNIIDVMDYRINKLIDKRYKSIKSFNKSEKDKWPHIFIFVDEGCNLINNEDIQRLFVHILDYGKVVGIHLIYATNAYLKDYTTFIDKFQYKMTFDLASKEQAKYIDIENANWLRNNGEALINGKGKTYKFQAPFVSTDEIVRVVLEIGK